LEWFSYTFSCTANTNSDRPTFARLGCVESGIRQVLEWNEFSWRVSDFSWVALLRLSMQICSHSLNSLISRRYISCWSYVKSDYVWCSNCYRRIQNSVQLLPHATQRVAQPLTCVGTGSRYCLLPRHRLCCKQPHRQKVSCCWSQWPSVFNTGPDVRQKSDLVSIIQRQYVVTDQYKVWQQTEGHGQILSGPTLKHVMFLRKYREKQLFVGTTFWQKVYLWPNCVVVWECELDELCGLR
jgi:hypothetical protein